MVNRGVVTKLAAIVWFARFDAASAGVFRRDWNDHGVSRRTAKDPAQITME
jgi:hypothetical protein